MKRTKVPSLPLLVGLVACGLLLAGCPSERDRQGQRPARLVLANVHAEGHPTAEALRLLAADLEVDPGLAGRFRLDLQLAGALGGEKEILETLRFGGIQMACASAAPLAEFAPEIGVLTLPFLFRDRDHLWQALDGPVGEELLATLEPHGFVGLAWYDAGARSFYNRRRPIASPEDLRGLKIRVQQAELMRETVRLLGGTPVALGFKEVYTSLYTGHVDGAENNLPSYYSERHFEVARHFSLNRHSTIPDLVLVGAQAWSRLSPSERDALRSLAQRSAMAQRGLWEDAEIEARRAVEAAGAVVREIEDLEPFREAVAPLYLRYQDRYGDWVERLRAVGTRVTS